MRHVSGTHRVALDWLFDRINLDRKIQIKNVDTKNQLADMLTKGNFIRDEWNHLLRFGQRRKNGETFFFPISDKTVKLSGGDQVFRKSTLIRDQTERGEERTDYLRGESDGSYTNIK